MNEQYDPSLVPRDNFAPPANNPYLPQYQQPIPVQTDGSITNRYSQTLPLTNTPYRHLLLILLAAVVIFIIGMTLLYNFLPPSVKSFADSYIQPVMWRVEPYLHKISGFTPSVLSVVRQEIIPSIVQVRCADEPGGEETKVGSGMFYFDPVTFLPSVQTNAHVVIGSNGNFNGCNVYFPDPSTGAFYDSAYYSSEAYPYHDIYSYVGGKRIAGIDVAVLTLNGAASTTDGTTYDFPPPKFDAFTSAYALCRREGTIEIGEPLFLVGYPSTGGDSITLTEGVVSGFTGDNLELIKVSANTNRGNSGGMALSQKDGCYYGIPVSASFEEGANLGFVLSSGFIEEFIRNATPEKTFLLPAPSTPPSTYLKNSQRVEGLSIKYPVGWNMSTTTATVDGYYAYTFAAPLENALDVFYDGVIINVYPGVAAKDYKELADILRSEAAQMDPDAQEYPMNLGKGAVATHFSSKDILGQLKGVPTVVLSTIIFYKGVMYHISEIALLSSSAAQYYEMFYNILDTIQLH